MSEETKCWGCREDQANQQAHMDPGGCLAEPEVETKPTVTCEGCLDNSMNELDHMEMGGCINGNCHPSDEHYPKRLDSNIIYLQNLPYRYDNQTNLLYTENNRPICHYDPKTRQLSPL